MDGIKIYRLTLMLLLLFDALYRISPVCVLYYFTRGEESVFSDVITFEWPIGNYIPQGDYSSILYVKIRGLVDEKGQGGSCGLKLFTVCEKTLAYK